MAHTYMYVVKPITMPFYGHIFRKSSRLLIQCHCVYQALLHIPEGLGTRLKSGMAARHFCKWAYKDLLVSDGEL